MVKFANITGLSDEQVKESRAKNGDNSLPPPNVESFFDKLKDNFGDPIIQILLVALTVTLVLSLFGYTDWVESLGIAIAVFLATFISTFSEYKNESSFRDLQEQASNVSNRVFRRGVPTEIPASEIVVGDFVLLQAGDKVPADGLMIEGEIRVNQASLNGEPDPVTKLPPSDPKYSTDRVGDFLDHHIVYRGAIVEDGEGVFRVNTVGVQTFYGNLCAELAAPNVRLSPLQVKLANLAQGVSKVGYLGASSIGISYLFKKIVADNQYDLERMAAYFNIDHLNLIILDVVTALILGVIVIVVAVPEGLPMMIALVLSRNMRKLLASQVLVRKLMGIETAGSLDVLFVDKTGTLTKGEFTPRLFIDGNGSQYDDLFTLSPSLAASFSFTIRESASANIGADGKAVGGNSSDRALLEYIVKYDRQRGVASSSGTHHLVREILFSSARKFSAVQLKLNMQTAPKHLKQSGDTLTVIKGAPDILFRNTHNYYDTKGEKYPLTADHFERINRSIDANSRAGIRVLALGTTTEELSGTELPRSIDLIGVVGIEDQIRIESAPAIALASSAGVHTIMITGDRLETACSVAESLGLLKNGLGSMTSDQLRLMSDEELEKKVMKIGVIARALPTDKSRLVRVTQSLNKVVGMTGDGVNDSAALKAADVGFSMGSGSEVAKEASSIVILDDNFKSITQAVLYGRTIFKSIRKFIVFQLTVNSSSFLIVFLGPFFGYEHPLTLIQLLWINLVMDTLAALAFGGEPALERYMKEPPIRRDQPIISKQMWASVAWNGLFIAAVCLFSLQSDYVKSLFVRNDEPSEAVFLSAFFAFFIFLTNFNSFNVRTMRANVFDNITKNVGFLIVSVVIFTVQTLFTEIGGSVLRTVGLTLHEWAIVVGAAFLVIPWDIARKIACKIIWPNSLDTF